MYERLAQVGAQAAEDAFRLAMIGAEGDLRVFWLNGLVGTITTLAFILLFWPLISRLFDQAKGMLIPDEAHQLAHCSRAGTEPNVGTGVGH